MCPGYGLSSDSRMVCHIASRPDWEAPKAAGEYRVSTKGITLELRPAAVGSLKGREFSGDAGPVVVVEVTPHQGAGVGLVQGVAGRCVAQSALHEATASSTGPNLSPMLVSV